MKNFRISKPFVTPIMVLAFALLLSGCSVNNPPESKLSPNDKSAVSEFDCNNETVRQAKECLEGCARAPEGNARKFCVAGCCRRFDTMEGGEAKVTAARNCLEACRIRNVK